MVWARLHHHFRAGQRARTAEAGMGRRRGGPHGGYEVGLGSPKSSPLLIVHDLRKLSGSPSRPS